MIKALKELYNVPLWKSVKLFFFQISNQRYLVHSIYFYTCIFVETVWCDKCKKDQRYECLGLEDGTVVCICEGYYKNRFDAPSLCFFPEPRKSKIFKIKLYL